jgi:two-component system, OmpR family, response regulator
MKNVAKKKILIIDDDIDYLYQMKTHIENFGFDTKAINNQKEGEQYILTNKPDLVVVDLMMENPDSGFVLCYKIKKQYPDVPVIIATAVTSEAGIEFDINTDEDRQWIKADSYIEKGIRPDQLHREINKLLKI